VGQGTVAKILSRKKALTLKELWGMGTKILRWVSPGFHGSKIVGDMLKPVSDCVRGSLGVQSKTDLGALTLLVPRKVKFSILGLSLGQASPHHDL